MSLNFSNTQVIRKFGNWRGAYPVTSPKATSVHIHPSRLTNGNDVAYPAFQRNHILPKVDIFGRAITNKPGIYPYGSATGTTPVTSTSLKAGTYKRAKIKGKGVTKRKAEKIWGRYVPDEYIRFDGSSWLNLAPLTTESEIEITFRRENGYTQTNFLFGTNPGGATDPCVGAWYESAGFTVQNGSIRNSATLDTNWHTLKVTSTKTYLDGAELASAGTRSYFQNLVIGSARAPNSSGAVDSRGFRGDISRVKVGNKIFVAGKDVVANTFGLIDPAENKFYGNSSTGTITGGSLIQPISFAESDGTAWADTETKITDSDEVYLEGCATDSNSAFLLSQGLSSNDQAYWLQNASTGLLFDIQNSSYRVATGISAYNTIRKIHIKNKQIFVDGVSKGTSSGTLTDPTDTAKLMYSVFASSAQKAKIVRLTVVGKCDYLPVRIGTTVELLDLASWSFATRTGTFTAGADIPYTELAPDILETNVGDALYGWYGDNMVWFDRPDAIKLNANCSSGKIVSANNCWMLCVPVQGNTTYSFLVNDDGKTNGWYFAEVSDDTVAIGTNYTNFTNRKGYNDTTVTTASDTKWIIMYPSLDLTAAATWYNNGIMMVESATVPTVIVPKTKVLHPSGEQTVTVGTQTRTITTFLPSATSFIDAQKASNNAECDWKFKVLDGTEDWARNTTVTGLFHISLAGVLNNTGVCTYYEWGGTVAGNMGDKTFACVARAGASGISIRDTRFNTKEELNAFLAAQLAKGEPIILAIPLATPAVTTVTLSEFTQPLGTVTILNEFADGTKGAVDFYGVNIQINTPVPKPDEPYPLLSNAGEVKVGYIQTQGKIVYDGSSDEVWTYDSGFHRFYLGSASLPADMKLGGTRTQQMFAPNWRCLWHGEAVSTAVNGDFYVGSNNVFFHSPEASVAAFKEMLQTNPIELYYQRTDDPSFIQPTNGFFGDGQQTAKMEGVNLLNDANIVTSADDMPTNLNCVFKGFMGTSDASIHNYTESTKYRVARAQLKAGTYTWWTDTPNCHTLRKSIGSVESSYSNDTNYYTFTLTEDAEFQMCWRNQSSTEFSGEHSMIVPGSVVPTTYSPYVTPQTRTTSEILPSATSKMNMQGGNDNKDCDWAFIQLDGSETGWGTATSGYYTLEMSDLKLSLADRTLYCTHLKSSATMPSTGEREGTCVISYGSSKGYISMGMVEQFPVITDFKAWLAENKPIIAYPATTSVKSTVQTTPFEVTKFTDYVVSSECSDGVAANVQVEDVEI